MTIHLDLTPSEALHLSAALSVYHNVAPHFGKDAFTNPDYEAMYDDNGADETEREMVELANHVNRELQKLFPNPVWLEAVNAMPLKEKRAAVLGTYSAQGAQEFARKSEQLMDQLIGVREQIERAMRAQNN